MKLTKRWDVGVNNNSFDSAGITKNCQEAVYELIRNGFEAHDRVRFSLLIGMPPQRNDGKES